ncbi:TIR domain-containing protein [Solibaculum mannosilyticum]|uniref:TIR domain-containing protein n=1 Tax=Solibaculum mannosilyticum TaxID=2780922 RepID=UPI0007A7EFB0|nr:hypothetical protein BN3661_02004 [Eubacteriaceae bacterium CHKCI005]
MERLECQKCGGQLDITQGRSIAVCEFCGEKMLVSTDAFNRTNLYNRANMHRRSCDFDIALHLYENILAGDESEADAYWGGLLCKYGIEYVLDQQSGQRIPTCHRVMYTSILDHPYYKKAIELAKDGKEILIQDANEIARVQKDILSVSQKENPFDVFICYKESIDGTNERTQDSVLAQDIYKELTRDGYNVFFARKTLAEMLGSEYEAKIFAALNSAPVMLVIGTQKEYVTAPWVKNEWMRYLEQIQQGKKKTIIPLYQEMSPYEFPSELSSFQALDMSKIGAMQELTDSIMRILGKKDSTNAQSLVDNLVLRGEQELSHSNWETAHEYFRKAVDESATCAAGWWGLLRSETENFLIKFRDPFLTDDQKMYFDYCMEYSSEEQKQNYIQKFSEFKSNVYQCNHDVFNGKLNHFLEQEKSEKLSGDTFESIYSKERSKECSQLAARVISFCDDETGEQERNKLKSFIRYRTGVGRIKRKYVDLEGDEPSVKDKRQVSHKYNAICAKYDRPKYVSFAFMILEAIVIFYLYNHFFDVSFQKGVDGMFPDLDIGNRMFVCLGFIALLFFFNISAALYHPGAFNEGLFGKRSLIACVGISFIIVGILVIAYAIVVGLIAGILDLSGALKTNGEYWRYFMWWIIIPFMVFFGFKIWHVVRNSIRKPRIHSYRKQLDTINNQLINQANQELENLKAENQAAIDYFFDTTDIVEAIGRYQ